MSGWESALELAYDEQHEWILANYGERAASLANYGWVLDGTDEPLVVRVATKVYGRGVLTTQVQERRSDLDVTHAFVPRR